MPEPETREEARAERNRQNGRKSQGPKTAKGREATDLSKLSHGIRCERPLIPGEHPAKWEAHLTAFMDDLKPQGATEVMLVQRIALKAWQLGRFTLHEISLIAEQSKWDSLPPFRNGFSGKSLAPSEADQERLLIYERHLEGSLVRWLHELQRLHATRAGQAVAAPLAVDIGVSAGGSDELG